MTIVSSLQLVVQSKHFSKRPEKYWKKSLRTSTRKLEKEDFVKYVLTMVGSPNKKKNT